MNIKKFSQTTGLSAYTIRYYEKIGLFTHIHRNTSGHRSFTDHDVLWTGFIKRLKDTGMPLDKIKEYAQLREKGEETASLRMNLLKKHAELLEEKIALENDHLAKLKEKIKYYEKLTNR